MMRPLNMIACCFRGSKADGEQSGDLASRGTGPGHLRETHPEAWHQACSVARNRVAARAATDDLGWSQRMYSALDGIAGATGACTTGLLIASDSSMGVALLSSGQGQSTSLVATPTGWLKRPADNTVYILRDTDGAGSSNCWSQGTRAAAAAALLRHAAAGAASTCTTSVVPCPQSHALRLAPGEALALPIAGPSGVPVGALLLLWASVADWPGHAAEAARGDMVLGPGDLVELVELARFVGFGLLLADPMHGRLLAQVSRHLADVCNAPSLQEALRCTLDAVTEHMLAKFSLQFSTAVALTHGLAAPAVLCARRDGLAAPPAATDTAAGASMRRSLSVGAMRHDTSAPFTPVGAASPTAATAAPQRPRSTASRFTLSQAQHGSGIGVGVGAEGGPTSAHRCACCAQPPVGRETERSMASISNLAFGAGAGGGGLGSTAGAVCAQCGGSLGAGGVAAAEVSHIRAIRTGLGQTLLLQALQRPLNVAAGGYSTLSASRSASVLYETTQGSAAGGKAAGSTCNSPDAPQNAATRTLDALRGNSGGAALSTVLVPNLNAHMLDEHQPTRDALLCSRLLSAPAGALVLVAELPAAALGTAPLEAELLWTNPEQRHRHSTAEGYGGGGGPPAMHSSGGQSDCAGRRTVEVGRSGSASGMSTAGGGSVRGAAAGMLPACAPHQLALYLLHPEALPHGVMHMVSAELNTLAPLLFRAFRLAISAPGSVAAAQWLNLQEQVLGGSQRGAAAGALDGALSSCGLSGALMHTDPASLTGTAGNAGAGGGGGGGGGTRAAASSQPCSTINRLMRAATAAAAAGGSSGSWGSVAGAGGLYGSHGQGGGAPPPAVRPNSLRSTSSGRILPSGNAMSPLLAGLHAKAIATSAGGVVGKGALSALATAHLPHDAACPSGLQKPAASQAGRRALQAVQEGGGSSSGGKHPRQAQSLHGGGALQAGGAEGARDLLHGLLDSGAELASDSGVLSGARCLDSAALHPESELLLLASHPALTLEADGNVPPMELLISGLRNRLVEVAADSYGGEEARAVDEQDLGAVQLLNMLGRGGQGVVFRGMLHGLEVAVKVLADNPAAAAGAAAAEGPDKPGDPDMSPEARALRQAKRGAMEAAVATTLSHPNIIQVLGTFSNVVVVRCQFRDREEPEIRLCRPGDEILEGRPPGPLNQVLALEYCDAGTLISAAKEGAFRMNFASLSEGPAWPNTVPLYTSLLEVALALRYLHARRLVHCDVKAENVLLKSSTRDPRGWTCKLSDYGCARMLNEYGTAASPAQPRAHRSASCSNLYTSGLSGGAGQPGPGGAAAPGYFRMPAPVGTLAYMAPECFVKDALLSPSVDCYAFGIMMWELLHATRPYAKLEPKDIPRQVLRNHLRPSFHPLAPLEYCDLAARCWSSRPERRPTALQLVAALEQLLSHATTERVSGAADARKFCSGGPRLAEKQQQQQQPRQHEGSRLQQQMLERNCSKAALGALQPGGGARRQGALDPGTPPLAAQQLQQQ